MFAPIGPPSSVTATVAPPTAPTSSARATTTFLPRQPRSTTTTAAPPPSPPSPPPVAPASTTTAVVELGPAPGINAVAWAVLDPRTDALLVGRNEQAPLPVGSLTKLLTAFVVLQAGDLDHVVTASGDLIVSADESSVGIYRGERLPRRALLEAMLVASANDAARVLANDLARSEQDFAMHMNAAAAELGLTGTTAVNATGLDADGNRSTARDMVVLADVLLADDSFAATVARTSTALHGQTFPTTNDLLTTYPGATGVKTGRTTGAGWCVVASAKRDGDRAIVAVLGAPTEAARDAGASALLDWALSPRG